MLISEWGYYSKPSMAGCGSHAGTRRSARMGFGVSCRGWICHIVTERNARLGLSMSCRGWVCYAATGRSTPPLGFGMLCIG